MRGYIGDDIKHPKSSVSSHCSRESTVVQLSCHLGKPAEYDLGEL